MKKIAYIMLLFFAGLISCKKDTAIKCIQGAVNPNCNCPLVTNYVCGCNNQTYDNSCYAACDGITTYTIGRCP
ncbi:MAG: hypothetical protein M3Z56_05075 [Bacteroidota bacterium]|nr:hypothetical protein [Bacteroidota bacterium]